jgi:lipoprotein-anchoring transpeptidase ErfK/SrfK
VRPIATPFQVATARRIIGGALLVAIFAAGCAPSGATPSLAGPSSSGSSPAPTFSAFIPTPSQAPSATQSVAPPVDACPDMLIGTVTAASIAARSDPAPEADVVATFGQVNPQGAPQVFDLLSSTTGADEGTWYKALLPVRPNGTKGFLPSTRMAVTQTAYRLVIDREKLELTLMHDCDVAKTYPIGLGTESTPTPDGEYYLVSLLQPPNANSVYGTYAYGLSAYSDALPNWAGGGVIGLHGTNDPSSIGNRESHGCIRMHNEDIEELVPLLPLGTPVTIK